MQGSNVSSRSSFPISPPQKGVQISSIFLENIWPKFGPRRLAPRPFILQLRIGKGRLLWVLALTILPRTVFDKANRLGQGWLLMISASATLEQKQEVSGLEEEVWLRSELPSLNSCQTRWLDLPQVVKKSWVFPFRRVCGSWYHKNTKRSSVRLLLNNM